MSAYCSSCDDPGCACISGECVNSACACSMPDTGDYCEQVASCQLRSWEYVGKVYRWLWTSLFAIEVVGVTVIAVLAIRGALKKLKPKALLKAPATLFWLFLCLSTLLRLISMASYGIAMDSPASIILYNLPVAFLMACFLLIGLMWLYMLKRLNNAHWSSRRASAIVVTTVISQLFIQTGLVLATLFLSPAGVQIIAIVYQLFVGLSSVAFLIFVVPTTLRVLRTLRRVEEFVTNTTERKGGREKTAIRRVALSLIGASALIGLLLLSFGFSTFLKFTTSALYFLVFNFIWRFIEFSSLWLLAYIMSASRATAGQRGANSGSGSADSNPTATTQANTVSLTELEEAATDADPAPL